MSRRLGSLARPRSRTVSTRGAPTVGTSRIQSPYAAVTVSPPSLLPNPTKCDWSVELEPANTATPPNRCGADQVTLRVPEVAPAATVADVNGTGLCAPSCPAERAAPAGMVAAEAVDVTAVPAPAATRVAATIRAVGRDRREEWFMCGELFSMFEVRSLKRMRKVLKMT